MTFRDCHNVRMQCLNRVWDEISTLPDFNPALYPASNLKIYDYVAWISMDPDDPERAEALQRLVPVFGQSTATMVWWALRDEVNLFLGKLKERGLSPTNLPAPTTPEDIELHKTLFRLRKTVQDALERLPGPYRAAEERGAACDIIPAYIAENGYLGYAFLPLLNIIQLRILRLDLDTSFGVLPVERMREIADEWWLGERFSASLTDAILYTRNLEDIMTKNPTLEFCGFGYVHTAFRVGCLHLAILNRYRELQLVLDAQGDPVASDSYLGLIEDSTHDVAVCLRWLSTMAKRWGVWVRELHSVFKRMVEDSEKGVMRRRKSLKGEVMSGDDEDLSLLALKLSIKEIGGFFVGIFSPRTRG